MTQGKILEYSITNYNISRQNLKYHKTINFQNDRQTVLEPVPDALDTIFSDEEKQFYEQHKWKLLIFPITRQHTSWKIWRNQPEFSWNTTGGK